MRDPPPFHGKCHFKFPFWLLGPFPNHYSMTIHQLWILSRLHSYFRASAFIIFILFIVQWNGDLNLWSQYHHVFFFSSSSRSLWSVALELPGALTSARVGSLYKKHHSTPFEASHYQINCPNLHTQFVTSQIERLQIFEMPSPGF